VYGEGYPPEEGSNIAPTGLYTFDVEVVALLNVVLNNSKVPKICPFLGILMGNRK